MKRFRSNPICALPLTILLIAGNGLEVRADDEGGGFFDRLLGKESKEEPAPSPRYQELEPFWETDSSFAPIVPKGVPSSFADLAERVSPAVVSIRTSQTLTRGPEFPRQFQEHFGFPFSLPESTPHKREGAGSGFVISRDGFIVTNNHVIEDSDEILVAFKDGRELSASIIGRDPKTDIALIKVEADEPLQAIPLGDSDAIRPGDWVVAIGNPFGLEHTVTAGIISAKHRRDVIGGTYDDFLQTDAAINPGNSGGPLINLSGEVIGINTAINPRANTIGFTVPINMVKNILPQLRAYGHFTRGWLGVVIQGISPELAESFDLESENGALVSKVLPNSPAEDAGVERGDVIIEFDGISIGEWRELPRVVGETAVSRPVEIIVIRDGSRKSLRVKIGAMEEPGLARADTSTGNASSFGLKARNLTPEIARQLGMEGADGVIVTEVRPGSPADEAGVEKDDLIIEINRDEISDLQDLRQHLENAGESVLMLIRRGDSAIYVPMKRPS